MYNCYCFSTDFNFLGYSHVGSFNIYYNFMSVTISVFLFFFAENCLKNIFIKEKEFIRNKDFIFVKIFSKNWLFQKEIEMNIEEKLMNNNGILQYENEIILQSYQEDGLLILAR